MSDIAHYSPQLHLDSIGNQKPGSASSPIADPPITHRPLLPMQLASHAISTLSASKTQTTGTITTTSSTDQATSGGKLLTPASLARKNGRYDAGFDALQGAVRARALQDAGRELGFELPVQSFMHDRWQLDGWLAQQSK